MQYITTKNTTLEIGRVCTTAIPFPVRPIVEKAGTLPKGSLIAILPTVGFTAGEDLVQYQKCHVNTLVIEDQEMGTLKNEIVHISISNLIPTNKLIGDYSTIDEKAILYLGRLHGIFDNVLSCIINTKGKKEALRLITSMRNKDRLIENFKCDQCGSVGKLLNKHKPKEVHYKCACGKLNNITSETKQRAGQVLVISSNKDDPNTIDFAGMTIKVDGAFGTTKRAKQRKTAQIPAEHRIDVPTAEEVPDGPATFEPNYANVFTNNTGGVYPTANRTYTTYTINTAYPPIPTTDTPNTQ